MKPSGFLTLHLDGARKCLPPEMWIRCMATADPKRCASDVWSELPPRKSAQKQLRSARLALVVAP